MVTEKEHETAQKEFFNKVCYEWDKTFDSKRTEQDELVKEIGLSGDEKILDVATGIGVMVPSYLRYLKNGSVRAIDYSENMIEVAKRRFPSDKFPNVSFEMMNLYDLDCEKEFDLVVCYSCLPHFFDHDRAIEILSDSLKAEGRLAVCNLKYHHVSHGGESEDHKKMMEHMPEHRFLTIPKLLEICEKHDLTLSYAANDDVHTLIIVTKSCEKEQI
ncbi:class I SAM-dependent methyltransferase [Methanomethylophilus alvi]|uniref:class I SAM-dependent methyltransferase n=1 Tax=Methanomethylophilus alvi TaxID=1291540 RepID=UPI0037DC65E7